MMEIIEASCNEYAERMKEARKSLISEFIRQNPQKEGESKEDYEKRILRFVEETPDEMLQHMRVYSNGMGNLYTILSKIETTLLDFCDLYKVTNEEKINEWIKKEASKQRGKQ